MSAQDKVELAGLEEELAVNFDQRLPRWLDSAGLVGLAEGTVNGLPSGSFHACLQYLQVVGILLPIKQQALLL